MYTSMISTEDEQPKTYLNAISFGGPCAVHDHVHDRSHTFATVIIDRLSDTLVFLGDGFFISRGDRSERSHANRLQLRILP